MMTRFTVVFDGVLDGKRLEDFTIDGATAVAYWDGDAIRQQVCFQHLAVYGAIDEITRLREALEQIASGGLFQHAHEFARATLEGKEAGT